MCRSQHVSLNLQENPLRKLFDLTVGPVIQLIHGDELNIVPDRPFWLAPYAAFIDPTSKCLCESFRIRLIPSLTSLKLITTCPVHCHSKTGALLVGDPWVQEVIHDEGQRLQQLPCAREKVEMIGGIVNVTPLTGTEATKNKVLSRLSSVALVHIAAHGPMETGEIALAPDPMRTTHESKEEDYLLTIYRIPHSVPLHLSVYPMNDPRIEYHFSHQLSHEQFPPTTENCIHCFLLFLSELSPFHKPKKKRRRQLQ